MLREVVVHKNPPKSYELLQELRDISSMAMEHFEEHIVPTMKRNQLIGSTIRNNNSSSPRFIRSLAEADDSDNESILLSPSSSTSCPPLSAASRTLNSLVRTSCSTPISTPAPMTTNSKQLELIVQQNRLYINSHKRQMIDLKTKVRNHLRNPFFCGRRLISLSFS